MEENLDSAKWRHCQRKRQHGARSSIPSTTTTTTGTSRTNKSVTRNISRQANIFVVSCSLFLSQFVLVTSGIPGATGQTLSPTTDAISVTSSSLPSALPQADHERSQPPTPRIASSTTPAVAPIPFSSGATNAAPFRSPAGAPQSTASAAAVEAAAAASVTGNGSRSSRPVGESSALGHGEHEKEQEEEEEVEIGQPPLPPQFMTQCAMSEHTCDNGRCIPMNKYCDNVNDCGDSSDEPRFCTRCNRTYYGNVGLTYDLELHRPKEDKIPYVCILTFSAAGGQQGDIVQIMLESFTIGRFVSYTQDGCPDGYLQIAEGFRQPMGGMWCGSSWGPVMIYSETRSLILTVKLFKLARDQAGYNFDFRIKFKVLSKESAVVRYGGIKYEELRPWMFESVNGTWPGNQSVAYPPTNYSVSSTVNPLAGTQPPSWSLPASFNGTKGGNKKQSKNGNSVTGPGLDQNVMRRGFNGSGPETNGGGGGGRNKQRNNRKQISGGGGGGSAGAAQNSDEGEWSERDATNYTEPKYYLGKLIQGTYCSRVFSDCEKRPCRMQSPNFPGVYPRNLTCFYAVRQHNVPPGKHALISVRQPKGNLIWIGTQATPGAAAAAASAGAGAALKNDKDKYLPKIQTWDECDHVQDYVTIYDGYDTRDPIILKFCGGGQQLPPVFASGPELLVEFTTSPYGTFLTPPPNINGLNGFQFEVEVKFVDMKTTSYVENKKLCEFWIRGTGRGVLENPQHSVPPNTTCLYHFQGTDSAQTHFPLDHLQMSRRGNPNAVPPPTRFKVWVSVLKFDLAQPFGTVGDQTTMLQPTPEDCSGMMRIWDGPLRESPQCRDLNCERDPAARLMSGGKFGQNYTSVLSRYCRGNVPRSCEYNLLNETRNRPCLISESYVSSSEFLTLEVKNTESTALRPLTFRLKYEFVDLQQDGIPAAAHFASQERPANQSVTGTQHVTSAATSSDCHRRFVSSLMERKDVNVFKSARNVFFFGRGGAKNLSCVHRFEAQRGERVRVVMRRVMTGRNRTCESRVDDDTNRSYCFGDPRVRVEIFERPWHDSIPFFRGCMCNSTGNSSRTSNVSLPVIYTSTSRELEIHFTAINMTDEDDPEHIQFEGTFEFIKAPVHCKDSRRKFGASGIINLAAGELECRSRPWLIEPTTGVTANEKFLYVRMFGLQLYRYDPMVTDEQTDPKKHSFDAVEKSFHRNSIACASRTRAIITTGEGLSVTLCPMEEDEASDDQVVEVFSSGWNRKFVYLTKESPKQLSVELLEPDTRMDLALSWLEMSRSPLALLGEKHVSESCQFRCPELDACVNASVWCNGKSDCPSGYDESFTHCSAILQLPAEVLAALSAFIVALCCGFGAVAFKKVKNHFRSSSVLQTRLKSLSSMDTAVFDDKDVIS